MLDILVVVVNVVRFIGILLFDVVMILVPYLTFVRQCVKIRMKFTNEIEGRYVMTMILSSLDMTEREGCVSHGMSPEQVMWLAVLTCTVEDVEESIMTGLVVNKMTMAKMRGWMARKHFRFVCDCIGLHHGWVRERLHLYFELVTKDKERVMRGEVDIGETRFASKIAVRLERRKKGAQVVQKKRQELNALESTVTFSLRQE